MPPPLRGLHWDDWNEDHIARHGVTREEIREVFLQVAIYAGVPAAIDSFRIAREVFDAIDAVAQKA